MKRIISLILVLVLVFSLVGCKKQTNSETAVSRKGEEAAFDTETVKDDVKEPTDDKETTKEDAPEAPVEANPEKEDASEESVEANPEKEDAPEAPVEVNPEKEDAPKTPAATTSSQSTVQTDGDSSYAKITFYSGNIHYVTDDIFVGEVLSRQVIEDCKDFPNISVKNAVIELCTVRVSDIYRCVYTQKDTVIRVAKFTNGDKKEAYEIGKKYVIFAKVQPYEDGIVMVDSGEASAELLQDGKLRTTSVSSARTLKNITTLDELKENFISKISPETFLCNELSEMVDPQTNEKMSKEQITSYLKEAILAGENA